MSTTARSGTAHAHQRRVGLHWPRIFGYDYFISFKLGPAPIGAQSYCSDLARRLRELDFTVFFSEEEASPGTKLDTTLQKALRRSRILVVVVNEGAIVQSKWVRREVEEFRRINPSRLVIPIDVGGAIGRFDQAGEVSTWLGHDGRIWLDEREEALSEGIANAEVIQRLQVSHRFLRVNTLLRWALATIALTLFGLTLWASYEAWDAKRKFREGTALRLAAEGVAMTSGQKAGGAVRGLLQVLAARRISPSADVDTALQAEFLKFQQQTFIREVDNSIASLAFSPDGASIVTGSYNGSLQWWDAKSGRRVGAAWSGRGPMSTIGFTADGSRIVSGNPEGNLQLWDASTRQAVLPRGELPRPWFNWSVAVSADGSRFAWGRESGEIEPWDLTAGQSMGKFRPKDPPPMPIPILSMTFSPDNRLIAFYTGSGIVGIVDGLASKTGLDFVDWIADTGAGTMGSSPLDNYGVHSGVIAFAPDGNQVVSGSAEGSLQLWDVGGGKALLASVGGHEGGVTGIAYSLDGKRIYSVGNDAVLRIWNSTTLKTIARMESAHTAAITAIALDRAAKRFATASLDNTLRIWNGAETAAVENAESAPVDNVTAVGFDRDGEPIVTGARIQTALRSAIVLARSPEGSRYVMHNVDATLTLWDANANKALTTLTANGAPVRGLMFSPNGGVILSLDSPNRILLWDADSGKVLPPVPTGDLGTVSVAMTQDGRTIATGGHDGIVRVWKTASGKLLLPPIKTLAQAVSNLALSPDGRRVVTASGDGALRLWNCATGELLLPPFVGHQAGVSSVAFSPDGLHIVSGGGIPFQGTTDQPRLDYSLRLWEVASGRSIGRPMPGHAREVTGVAFSRDGKRILSTSSDGKLRVWDVFEGWSDALCAKLARNPTLSEWKEWVSPDIAYSCPCPGLVPRDNEMPAACRRDDK